jgi:putative DNA primase/helicase
MDDRPPLDDLKAYLAENAEALAIDLFGLPKSRSKRQLCWGNKSSLVVTLSGKYAGKFRSWEENHGGSMLDAIAFANDSSFTDAIEWARRWRGEDPLPRPKRHKPVISNVDDEEKRRIEAVKKIRADSIAIGSTPGEQYLRSRAITPDAQQQWPESVRWHPGGYLVFVCTSPQGETTAIQRIYVQPDGTPKLDNGRKVKRSLGPRYGGAVHFEGGRHGGSASPLCIAEGPETALSVWSATGYETWAALGQVNSVSLKSVPLDRTIIVCRDDDAHIAPSKKAVRDAIREWRKEGRTVLDVLPWKMSRRDKSDFNDALKEHGKTYVRARIEGVLNTKIPSHLNDLPILEARKKLARETDDAVNDLWQHQPAGNLPAVYVFSDETGQLEEEQPVNVLKVGLGIGKTREGISAAIRWHKQGRGPIVYAVPTHHLSGEVLSRIKEQAKGEITVEVWRGREAQDPESDGDQMCLDLDAVRAVQSVGGNAQELVCAKDGRKCALFDICGFQRQRQKKADMWVVSHASLFSEKPEAIQAPSLLIIDEAFWQQGVRGTGNEKVLISTEDLRATPGAPSASTMADLTVELKPIRHKLIEALDGRDGPIRSEWLDGLTADQCRSAAKMEWQRKIKVNVYPGMSREDRALAIKAAQGNIGIERMARMWREMAYVIENEIAVSGRLSFDDITDEKTRSTYKAIRVIWRTDIKKGWKAPTLHYDATMQMDLVREYFPQAVLRAEIEAATPHQIVTQYHDKTFSSWTLKNEKQVDKLWLWSKAKAMRSGGRWLVVVQKHVEDSIRARHKIPSFIDIAHHNAIAGRDEWRDVRGLIVAGRTAPPPIPVEQIAGALSGKHIEPVGEWYPAITETITARDGSKITVEADRHPNTLAEQIRYAINETELMQIIGRARGVSRQADGPVEIMVLGDTPLPVELDALQEWCPPSKDDEFFAESGVWLESSGDMAAALDERIDTIRKARQRTGTFPYKDILYENVPVLRLATYMRAGPGRKVQRVAWDERIIPDIGAFLSSRLGPLVELSLDEAYDYASARPVETVAVADQPLTAPDHLYVGGILPGELVDEMEAVRRGACMTLDQVAANIGISRPQLSNARMGRYGLSASAADRLMVWLSQPPPIRQMRLSL